MRVSEVFGPVWQGEGPHAGQRCAFLRLGLCNLSCDWCDTPWTWDRTRFDVAAECPTRTAGWVLDRLGPMRCDLLVLSGGEPLIHHRDADLAAVLDGWPGRVDVETNGTLPPPAWHERVGLFVVSPKLWTGGPGRIRPDVLAAWQAHPRAVFKVVVQDAGQVAEVAGQPWATDPSRVWVMPEGVTAGKVLDTARNVAGATAEAGFNLSLRHHVLMYGDERGR